MADIWSYEAAKERHLAQGPRFFFGTPRQIDIFLTKDIKAEPLRVTVQAYTTLQQPEDSYSNPRQVGFPGDCVPSHRKLRRWVEDQVGRSSGSALRHVLPNFLMAYTHEGAGMPRVSSNSHFHFSPLFHRCTDNS